MQKAKHAFGNSSGIDAALQSGAIDNYDILFLDGDTDPKVGWVDKNGVVRIVKNGTDVDLSGIESELATKADAEDVVQLGVELATKVSAEEVDSKIELALKEIECEPITYEKVKYEIGDAPVGTLVDYKEDEIRILIPENAQFTKQSVGVGGDPNTYYVTFKTYVYNDDVVGYKETLNGQTDAEILKDLKEDAYGRRYQPTWLGVAKYDESTDTWTYNGATSTTNKYIGWDYTLQMYNANDVMIASDSVRINLSNEGCHYAVEPYYINKAKAELEETVTKTVEEKVTKTVEETVTKAVEDAVVIEVIEF